MSGVKRESEDFKNDDFIELKKRKIEIGDSSKESEEKVRAVFLLSYVGKSCFSYVKKASRGFNKGSKVEAEFIKALYEAAVISYEEFNNPKLIDFKTAVYTPNKMPAARNFASLLIPLKHISEDAVRMINSFLPTDVTLSAIKRVTPKFDPIPEVISRTYSYMLPTFALAPTAEESKADYRIPAIRMQEVRDSLENYVGTMNFYDFVSLRLNKDVSGEIQSLICTSPFELYDLEFCLIKVRIKTIANPDVLSLMRQTIGLVISSLRNITSIKRCMEENLYIPGAPKFNIMLEEPHFDNYNQRISGSFELEQLQWAEFDSRIERFRQEQICSAIAETERTEKVIQIWLDSLDQNKFQAKDW